MNRKAILIEYGIPLFIVVLPLALVVGNLLAITDTTLAQIFRTPPFVCVHINCLFLLAPSTVHQLLLITACGVLSLVYLLVFVPCVHNASNRASKEQLMMLGVACYCVYIQILRIILSFTIFQYNLHWWMLLISRISIFSFALHAGMFFVHSFLITMKRKMNALPWGVCALFISFSITYLIPLDRHLLTEQLIHKAGYFDQLQVVIIIVYTITLINYTQNYVRTRKGTDLRLQAGYVFQTLAMYVLFLTEKSGTVVIIAIIALMVAIVCLSEYTASKSRAQE